MKNEGAELLIIARGGPEVAPRSDPPCHFFFSILHCPLITRRHEPRAAAYQYMDRSPVWSWDRLGLDTHGGAVPLEKWQERGSAPRRRGRRHPRRERARRETRRHEQARVRAVRRVRHLRLLGHEGEVRSDAMRLRAELAEFAQRRCPAAGRIFAFEAILTLGSLTES